MPTLGTMNIPTPKGWDEFEDITLSALQVRWPSRNFYRNGRQGQRQDGVDIYGNNLENELIAVQCKNTIAGVTEKTVNEEIANASSFTPEISELFIATTANRDAALQKAIRIISDERNKKKLFKVSLLFWDDICNSLIEDEGKFFKHYPQLRQIAGGAKKHDEIIFDKIVQLLPSNGVIRFLDETNMAGFSFQDSKLEPLREYYFNGNTAEQEFIDASLEELRLSLYNKVDSYLEIIATETWLLENNTERRSVPQEWEFEQPTRFFSVVNQLHNGAKDIVEAHQNLIRKAKAIFISDTKT